MPAAPRDARHHTLPDSLYAQSAGDLSAQRSRSPNGHCQDHQRRNRSLVEVGSFVLLLFSVVLLGSGSAILTTCFMSETAAASLIRSTLLPSSHPLSILFYSLILTASVMCFVALVTICSVCCCSSSNAAKAHHTTVNSSLQEAEMLMMDRLRGEPDLHSTPLSLAQGQLTQSNGRIEAHSRSGTQNGHSKNSNHFIVGNGEPCDHGARDQSYQAFKTVTSSSSSPPSCLFCFLIFMLLFLLTIQLTVSFIGFVSSSSLQSLARHDNQASFIEALLFPTSETPHDFLTRKKAAFDQLQPLLKCCGLREFTDYDTKAPVPESCCRTPTKECGRRLHPSNIYYDGCAPRIQQSISDDMTKLSALSLGFSTVAATGLVLSCYFYVRLINEHERKSLI